MTVCKAIQARRPLLGFLLFVGMASPLWGLIYAPKWNFVETIGVASVPDSYSYGNHGAIVYDATTGSLSYDTAGQVYRPPNIASLSGSLIENAPLTPAPFARDYSIGSDPVAPFYRSPQTIDGELVTGSNGIHLQFDAWSYWPLSISELDGVPARYDYGRVLPIGLDEEFLMADLHTAVFPGAWYDLRVVPEPSAACLTLLALVGLIGAGRSRRD